MEAYLPHIFALNIFLTILDATVGYHAAPLLVRIGAGDSGVPVDRVRSMLGLVVALYSFFSCLAFFDRRPVMLMAVSAFIIAHVIAQLAICRKLRSRNP